MNRRSLLKSLFGTAVCIALAPRIAFGVVREASISAPAIQHTLWSISSLLSDRRHKLVQTIFAPHDSKWAKKRVDHLIEEGWTIDYIHTDPTANYYQDCSYEALNVFGPEK